MYTSLAQLVRGWSRILYDALGRNLWHLIGKLLDPVIFLASPAIWRWRSGWSCWPWDKTARSPFGSSP